MSCRSVRRKTQKNDNTVKNLQQETSDNSPQTLASSAEGPVVQSLKQKSESSPVHRVSITHTPRSSQAKSSPRRPVSVKFVGRISTLRQSGNQLTQNQPLSPANATEETHRISVKKEAGKVNCTDLSTIVQNTRENKYLAQCDNISDCKVILNADDTLYKLNTPGNNRKFSPKPTNFSTPDFAAMKKKAASQLSVEKLSPGRTLRSASPKTTPVTDDTKRGSRVKDRTEKLKPKTRNSPCMKDKIKEIKSVGRDTSKSDNKSVVKSPKRSTKTSKKEPCIIEDGLKDLTKKRSRIGLTQLDAEVLDPSSYSVIRTPKQRVSRSRVNSPVTTQNNNSESKSTPECSTDQSPSVKSPKKVKGTKIEGSPRPKSKSPKRAKDTAEDTEPKRRKKTSCSSLKEGGKSKAVSESPSPTRRNRVSSKTSVKPSPNKDLTPEISTLRSLRKHHSPSSKPKGDQRYIQQASSKMLTRKPQDQIAAQTENANVDHRTPERNSVVSLSLDSLESNKSCSKTTGGNPGKVEIEKCKTEVDMEESEESDESDTSEYSDTGESSSSDSDTDTTAHVVRTLDMSMTSENCSSLNEHNKMENIPSTSSETPSLYPSMSEKSNIDYNKYRTYLSHESRVSVPLGLSDLIAKVNCSIDGVDTKMNVLFGEAEEPDYCDENVKLGVCDSEGDSDKTIDFSVQASQDAGKTGDSVDNVSNDADDDNKKQIETTELDSSPTDDDKVTDCGDNSGSIESTTNNELNNKSNRTGANSGVPISKGLELDFMGDEHVQPLQIDVNDVGKNASVKHYPTSPIKLNKEKVKVALTMTGNLLSPVTLPATQTDEHEKKLETVSESGAVNETEMDTSEPKDTEANNDKTIEAKDVPEETTTESCEIEDETPRNIFDLFGITLKIRRSDGSSSSGTDGKMEQISSTCENTTENINEHTHQSDVSTTDYSKQMDCFSASLKMVDTSDKLSENIAQLENDSTVTDANKTQYSKESSIEHDTDTLKAGESKHNDVLSETTVNTADNKDAIVILSDEDDDDQQSVSAFSVCSSIDRVRSLESLRASPRIRPTMTTVRQTYEPKPLEVLSRVEKQVTNKKSIFVCEELEDYIETNKENMGAVPVTDGNKSSEKTAELQIQMSEEDVKNQTGNSNPGFNEIDELVFLSFPSEESLKAHVEVEKKVDWLSEPLLRKMCSLKSMHERATDKDHYRTSEVKSKDEQKQNYRGLPARVKKYEKLFKQELDIILAIKEKRIPSVLVTKTPEKTPDITKIKGWKEKYGSTEELKEATGLHFTDAGKLHWRTEERILKKFNADDVKDIGLDIKKKRRKLVNFSKKKSSNKSDTSAANPGNDDTDVVYEGYVYDKNVSFDNETSVLEGEDVHKKEPLSEEKVPYSIRFRSQYKYGVRKLFVKKMGLDAIDELILKKLGTASEYLRDPNRDKEGQSKNKKGNKPAAMKLTQGMAAAAASAVDKKLIIKAKAMYNLKEKKKQKGGVKKDVDKDYIPTRDDDLQFFENQIRDDETIEECQNREEQRKREVRNARRREARARKSAENLTKPLLPSGDVEEPIVATEVKQEPMEEDSFEITETDAEKKCRKPEHFERDKDVDKKCEEPGCRYGCICHLCKFSDSGGEDKDTKHPGDHDSPVKPSCDKEYCKLGCICDSIDTKVENSHCRKAECMFQCKCSPKQPIPDIPKEDKSLAKKRKRRSCSDKKPADEDAPIVEGNAQPDEPSGEPIPEPDDVWEPPLSKKKRGPTRFSDLPRRKSTYRLAKNLDAVSRKAMQVYETSEKFDMVRIRKRRIDPADEIEFVNDEVDPKPVDPIPAKAGPDTNRYSSTTPAERNKQKLDWREALQMATLDNPEDVLKQRDDSVEKPSASSSKTKMSAYNRRPVDVWPELFASEEADEAQEQEPSGSVMEVSDWSDGEAFPEGTESCARIAGYQGEWKKRAPQQKVSRSNSQSPDVIDLIDSDNEMDTVDGYKQLPSRSYVNSGGSVSEKLGLTMKKKVATPSTSSVPGADAKWRTQMVCLKAKKTQDSDDTTSDESEIKLLEIISNCKWEHDRKNMLSKISHIISKDYPQNHVIMWCNYVMQFLPQADKPAIIPPELQAKLPHKMFSIRVRVTKNMSDIESADKGGKNSEEKKEDTQKSKWEQAMSNLTTTEKRNYLNLRQQKKLIEKIRFAERLKEVIITEESKGSTPSKFSVSREGIEKALKRYKTQLWKAFTGNSGMTITQLKQALQSAKNASYTDRINQAIEAIENKANSSHVGKTSIAPGLSPSTAARIQANQGMVIQRGTALSTVVSERQNFVNLSMSGSGTFSDITKSQMDISTSPDVTIVGESQQPGVIASTSGTSTYVIGQNLNGNAVVGQNTTTSAMIGQSVTGTTVISRNVLGSGSTVIGQNAIGTIVIGQTTKETTVIGQNAETTVIGQNAGTTVIGQNAETTVIGQNAGTTVIGQNVGTTVIGQNVGTTVIGQNAGTTVIGQNSGTTVIGQNTTGSAIIHQNVRDKTMNAKNVTVTTVSSKNCMVSATVSGTSVVSQSKSKPAVGSSVMGTHGIPPVLPMGKMLLVPVDGAGPRRATPILSGTMTMVAGDRMPAPGSTVHPVFAGNVGPDAKTSRMPVSPFNVTNWNAKNPNQNIQQVPQMIGGMLNGQRVLFRPDQLSGSQVNQVRPFGGPNVVQNVQFQGPTVLVSPSASGLKSIESANPGHGTNLVNGVKTSVVNNVPVSLQNGAPHSTTVCSTAKGSKFIPIPSVNHPNIPGTPTFTPIRLVGPMPLNVSSTTGGPIPMAATAVGQANITGQPNHPTQMFRVLQMAPNTASDGKPILHLIPVTSQGMSNAVTTTSSTNTHAKIASVELLQPAVMSNGILTMGSTTSGPVPSVSPDPTFMPSSSVTDPRSNFVPTQNGRVSQNVSPTCAHTNININSQIVSANKENCQRKLSENETSLVINSLTRSIENSKVQGHVPQVKVNNEMIDDGNVCDLTKCDSDVEGFDDSESLTGSLRSFSSLGDSIKSCESAESIQKVNSDNLEKCDNADTNRASPTNDLINNFIEYATETGFQIADTLGPIDKDEEAIRIGNEIEDAKSSESDMNVIDVANNSITHSVINSGGEHLKKCTTEVGPEVTVLCVEDEEADSDGCLIIDEPDDTSSKLAQSKTVVSTNSTESRKRKLTGEGSIGSSDVGKRSRSESPMTMEEIMTMVGEDMMTEPSADSIYISDSEDNSDIDVESLENVDQLLRVPPVNPSRRKSSQAALDCDDNMKITKMLQGPIHERVLPPLKSNRERVRRKEAAALFRNLAVTVYKHHPERMQYLDRHHEDRGSILPKVTILKETKILMDALQHKMDRLQESLNDGLEYQNCLKAELVELTDSFVQSGVPKNVIQNFLKSVSKSTLSFLKCKAKDNKENGVENLNIEFEEINPRRAGIEQVSKIVRNTDQSSSQFSGADQFVQNTDLTSYSNNQSAPSVLKLPVFPLQVETPHQPPDPTPQITSAEEYGITEIASTHPQSLLNKSVSFTIKCRRAKPKVEIFIDSPESSRGSPDVTQHLQTSTETVTDTGNVCKITPDINLSQISQQSNLADYEIRSSTGDGIVYSETISENSSQDSNLNSNIQINQSDLPADYLNLNSQTVGQSNDVIVLDSDVLPSDINSNVQSDVVVIEDSPIILNQQR